jgi:peptide/nickel transport system permease protein
MTKAGWIGLVLVGAASVVAVLAPQISTHDYRSQASPTFVEPFGSGHLLGTDELGRDVFSRLVHGARTSMLTGLTATFVALVIGTPLGMLAGYYGGALDDVLGRIVDVAQGIPVILMGLVTAAIFGPSLTNIILALSVIWWTAYARLARGETLSIKEKEYVEASRASGASVPRILLRHALPNIASVILVTASLHIGTAIVVESSLSFLGLGVQPPTPSWGGMLSNGRLYVFQAAHLSWIPGLAIFFTVLGFNLLGDGLRSLLDPKASTNTGQF